MCDQLRIEVLYGRNTEELRVFVSSQMDGTLDAERRAAAKTINESQTHRAWWWEDDSSSGSYWAEAECIGYAGCSDGLLLLFGTTLTRVTRGEYEAARANGADCYIFIRDSDQMDAAAASFVQTQQRQSAVTRKFANLSELQSGLTRALHAGVVRATRERNYQRRIEFGTSISAAHGSGPSSKGSRQAT